MCNFFPPKTSFLAEVGGCGKNWQNGIIPTIIDSDKLIDHAVVYPCLTSIMLKNVLSLRWWNSSCIGVGKLPKSFRVQVFWNTFFDCLFLRTKIVPGEFLRDLWAFQIHVPSLSCNIQTPFLVHIMDGYTRHRKRQQWMIMDSNGGLHQTQTGVSIFPENRFFSNAEYSRF